jgi:preprotein translocase subunit YajC
MRARPIARLSSRRVAEISPVLAQNVQPNAPTPGVAAPSAPVGGAQQAPPQGGGLIMLLPILMLLPFFFLMFRRNKKESEARGKLKRGDRIASQSGLVGELVDIDERFAKVKLAPGTTVTMLASSISPLVEPAAATEKDSSALKDLKEAKAAGDKK